LAIYADERRTEKLVSVRESAAGWLAALTGYEAFDRDEVLLGSFGGLMLKSLQRSTWQFDQPGLGRFLGRERSVRTARGRRLLAFGGPIGEIAAALVTYHFDFGADGETAFSIEKPKVGGTRFRSRGRQIPGDQSGRVAIEAGRPNTSRP
jgi:hypothetical protein